MPRVSARKNASSVEESSGTATQPRRGRRWLRWLIAFGIGTTQVRDILATQTMAISKMKVRRINVEGKLRPGVYSKDVILHIIRLLGANGGIGYAYEYGGNIFDEFTMEERMTVCNMSIEGGASSG